MATRSDSFPLHLGSHGPRVRDLQWLLAGNNKFHIDTYDYKRDWKFGKQTLAAVKAAKHQLGYKHPLNGKVEKPFFDYMTGKRKLPKDYLARRKERIVPKSSIVLPLHVPMGPGGDFSYVDAEGAPDNRGVKHHAAHDWFGPSGTPIYSPVTGTVIEKRMGTTTSGQVFGGTIKVQAPNNGKVFVFRHTVPGANMSVGKHVKAGDRIASISPWRDGPTHTHHEIWKTLPGGYDYENMLDPVPFYLKYAKSR